MSLLIIGSAAFDSIETPRDRRERVLGGSGVYASYAASFFTDVQLVGVVGDDWDESNTRLLQKRGIDTLGLEKRAGEKTLYWSGKYFGDMNDRQTLDIQLNVMGTQYDPIVPESYKKASAVFLANGAPASHLALLRQLERPSLVIADTMDFYINNTPEPLRELLRVIDGLVVNDSEVRLLTGESNIISAAKKALDLGPQFVIVKKGEHGSMLVDRNAMFLMPAYPTERVVDPTGAGDSFAGGLMGYLSGADISNPDAIKEALAYAAVVASFNVEGFSLERFTEIERSDIDRRFAAFRRMVSF